MRLRFLTALLALLLVLFTALRVVFWLAFHETDDPAGAGTVLHAFYLGLKFDLRLAVLLIIPYLIVSRIPRLNPERRAGARRFWSWYWTVLLLVVVFHYLSDFAHYSWLNRRVDAATTEDLQDTLMSLQVIWESYPIVWGALAMLAFGAGLLFVLRFLMERFLGRSRPPQSRRRRIAIAAWTVAFGALGLYGKLSWYPLRWSDAFASSHRFSASLALNPLLFFFDTLCTAEKEDYEIERVRAHYDAMAAYLGVEEPDREALSFERKIRPTPLLEGRRPNVVLIILESFGAHKTGFFGNALGPSPNFDAVAREAIVYRNFYSPRAGTAHAVFATITGIPDATTRRTATRNPRVVEQYTLLNEFEGYEKLYFLGGSANWANVRGLLSHNVDGLRLYEEGSYESERVDVWGVPDLHLMEEAHAVLSGVRDRPFFAVLHCSGNHRPWTIPEDNRGFAFAEVDDKALVENAFGSLDEFNSFRFMDHSLGHYFKLAREADYFENTIFLLFGDNGAPGRGPSVTPLNDKTGLSHFHTPFLVYAPGSDRKGEVRDGPGGQFDVMATAAGAAGFALTNRTMGRNLLDERYDDRRLAFVQTKKGAQPHIMLVGPERTLEVSTAGTGARLLGPDGEEDSGQVEEMQTLALGIYHTARYMIFHNRPEGR